MSTQADHYEMAEQILEEGRKAVAKIGELADERDNIQGRDDDYVRRFNDLTNRMDEYGKKAWGCWAQAQVHATLALAQSDEVEAHGVEDL